MDEKVILPIIFALSLAAGFTVGSLNQEEYRFESAEVSADENCTKNCEIYKPKYGAGWIQERGDKIYVVNNASSSGWADYYGIPPFWVEINEEGLRDEPFEPNNTEPIRILVLGTSTTLGYGVNHSYVFTERVERRLNEDFETEVQVLNAGSPGYGMKDYYKYLKFRGADFNPDMVVLAFKNIDWYSRRYVAELNREAAERVLEESNVSKGSTAFNKKFKKEVGDMIKEKWRQTPVEETDLQYLEDIQNLSESEGIRTVYYSIDNLRMEEKKQYIESWAERNNKEIYYSPEEYRNNFGNRVRISEYDSHPSRIGHRIIADGLYPILKQKISGKTVKAVE